MVIVHLSGGFGNQLFSYAFGYAVAKARNDQFYIDTAIQDAEWFFRNPDILKMNITYDKRVTYPITRKFLDRAVFNKVWFRQSIGWKTKELKEPDLQKLSDPIAYCKEIKGDIYLRGTWANESWFQSVSDEIRPLFTFKEELSKEAKPIYDEISSCETSVTVHVRRGDYVKIGVAMEPDYYIRAMEEIAKRVKNPQFYCFSEDLQWAEEAFKEAPFSIHYPEYHSEDKGVEDFRLLSAGKHQIISNSTYSWWAAYLNGNQDRQIAIPCREDTIWNQETVVEGWISLPFTMNGKPEIETVQQ